jgi:hypothetical protein
MLRIYFHEGIRVEVCTLYCPLLSNGCVKEETQNTTIFIFMVFVSEGREGEAWKHHNKTTLTQSKQVPLTLPLLFSRLLFYHIYSLSLSRKG